MENIFILKLIGACNRVIVTWTVHGFTRILPNWPMRALIQLRKVCWWPSDVGETAAARSGCGRWRDRDAGRYRHQALHYRWSHPRLVVHANSREGQGYAPQVALSWRNYEQGA